MKKIILDLCGGSGAWSKPYKDAEYDVRLITLPDNDIFFYEPPENVYGILAAPPCTMFSRARSRAKTPRDFKTGFSAVHACLKIIWQCQFKQKLEFWALENPMGLLRRFLGDPPWSFRGNEFGDDHIKFTDIWGNYNPPSKRIFIPQKKFDEKKWGKLSAEERGITPTMFAEAFFKANQ